MPRVKTVREGERDEAICLIELVGRIAQSENATYAPAELTVVSGQTDSALQG